MRLLSLVICLIPSITLADTSCGPFTLSPSSDGFMHINGQRPESQKITFLKEKDDFHNVKIQWMLPDQETGRYLGMDFIKRDGKAILNVEAIRMNMDEPRVFGTYDCVKAK
ncbi:hypothetical protein DEO48_25325 [Enterobacter sp. CGMCC 5087]|uniref:hypothetical protein n=1 Tax=Enterobacter sp. CGMCC 5087 TaxID=2183878 RepID=UPI000D67AB3A|nr:hypothetical protein [Enterobacter sp. CGMCC 5087]PWI77285.1 hypothetical protein DEO48_25325 [Enterobacter sp. CGMCC 5087]